jgi:hypothetical protein
MIEKYCEHEHPEEGCCLCSENHYKHYKYDKGMCHYHEYCEIGRKENILLKVKERKRKYEI